MSPTIAHILPFPHVGGTELATLRIAEGLRDRGFDHVAFCRSDATAVREMFESRRVKTYEWETVQPSFRHPAAFIRNSRRLARMLREARADMVHCADYDAAHFAATAGLFARLPVLCHVRNRWPDISRRDRTFLMPVDRYVFVSKQTWRDFGVRVPNDRGTVVYDGIDVPPIMAADDQRCLASAVRAEFGLPPSARLAGMVARIAPQKDYETLIKAAARVRAELPNLHFLLIGDYEHNEVNRRHHAQVQEWLRVYGGADRFVFTGYRTDVDRLIAALDVFVLSTHQEGLPLVLLEAMARAKAVAATAVDGVPELVEDGRTGYLHAHGDAETLAGQLREVLRTEGTAAALGRAARERVERQFSRETFLSAMSDVYDAMVRGKKRRRRG